VTDDGFPDAQTEAVPRLELSSFAPAPFRLEVVEGPDTGAVFHLDAARPNRMLIGKGPACDARLTDPSVSRRHAAVEVTPRGLRISDLDSTNGSFVDGVGIGEAYVHGGELLRIAGTALRIDRGEPRPAPLPPATGFGRVLGASAPMRRLYPLCERLAASDVPVVIEGETGTGKEQLAEALHQASPRAEGPYVVFDCTAVAPNLIESELFGHERGAFTGSVAVRRGVFERAQGGTLLIDEIGDLPLELQPKLLRALERGEITRVGGEQTIAVDVRVLAATRRDLDKEVQLGRFRDDLFHRVAVTRVELPPLRERTGDVALLCRHFAAELGGAHETIPADLVKRWEDAPWPGNVRELRNAVARRLALGDLADLPPSDPTGADANEARGGGSPARGDSIARVLARDLPLADARQELLDEFESRYIDHLLEQHGGNVTRAAAAAGVARRHLQRLKAKFDRDEG
jgi:DNA-binding NtrC family response regulator